MTLQSSGRIDHRRGVENGVPAAPTLQFLRRELFRRRQGGHRIRFGMAAGGESFAGTRRAVAESDVMKIPAGVAELRETEVFHSFHKGGRAQGSIHEYTASDAAAGLEVDPEEPWRLQEAVRLSAFQFQQRLHRFVAAADGGRRSRRRWPCARRMFRSETAPPASSGRLARHGNFPSWKIRILAMPLGSQQVTVPPDKALPGCAPSAWAKIRKTRAASQVNPRGTFGGYGFIIEMSEYFTLAKNRIKFTMIFLKFLCQSTRCQSACCTDY